MRNNEVDSKLETILPDSLSSNAKLCAKWPASGMLSVFKIAKDRQTVLSSSDQGRGCTIYNLKSRSIIFDPIVRNLVNESCGNFLSGQLLKDTPLTNRVSDLLKLSRQYRSILRACIEKLQCKLETMETSNKIGEDGDNDRDYYSNIMSILYNIEFIWHLTEILHIDVIPGDVVVPHLVEWIRFHFPEPERSAMNILNSIRFNREIAINGAENTFPEYWQTVIGLLLQGNIDLVRALLRLHSEADSDEFTDADKALRKMPIFNIYGGLSITEYINLWKGWQANVRDKIHSGSFSANAELDLLTKILVGDSSGLKRAKTYCNKWYQFMVALLLYTDPVVKSNDLCHHAHQCIARYGGPGIVKVLDMVVLALLDSDFKLAIEKFQLTSDCGWLATHLTNLLKLSGKLDNDDQILRNNEKSQCSVEEQLLLEYGILLMQHKSLWQIGLQYLDYCPMEGQIVQESLLSKMPLDKEFKIMKILQAAQDRDLNSVVSGICKIQLRKCLNRNRLGNALIWAIRAQDTALASDIADKFLHQYIDTGFFTSTDILNNLGTAMLLCDRLTFLGKYCDFHKLFFKTEYKKAAESLSELLASKMVPKYFRLTLLLDAVPLLEYRPVPLFSSEEISNFMYCLEELLADGVNLPCSILKEKVEAARVSFVTNLARAYVYEIGSSCQQSAVSVLATSTKIK